MSLLPTVAPGGALPSFAATAAPPATAGLLLAATASRAPAGGVGPSLGRFSLPFAFASGGGLAGGGAGGAGGWASRYLRRVVSPGQWDVDYALYQLLLAVTDPHKLYKLTQHRKQSKNQWARDDPAFAILLYALHAVAFLAWGVAYGYLTSPLLLAYLVVSSTVWQVVVGVATAAVSWYSANRWCRTVIAAPHSVEQRVEALYAWDVHTNALVASAAIHLLGLYAVAPLALAPGVWGTVLGNCVWVVGHTAYLYVSFWGYAGEGARWRPEGGGGGGGGGGGPPPPPPHPHPPSHPP
jgi:hypothetical protein